MPCVPSCVQATDGEEGKCLRQTLTCVPSCVQGVDGGPATDGGHPPGDSAVGRHHPLHASRQRPYPLRQPRAARGGR